MSKYTQIAVDLSNSNLAHTQLVRLVGNNQKVLDVGCANGALAQVLRDEYRCAVSGIEIDHEDAKNARTYCEKVIEGDIESLNPKEHFTAEEFDVILLADVLEHLKDPYQALKKIVPYTKEYIVLSVPNITHSAVLYELLEGKFEYRDLGLLDSTHLHFFTKHSLMEMLESCGLILDEMVRIQVAPEDTELEVDPSQFPEPVQRLITDREESDTYQFIVRARKKSKEREYIFDLSARVGDLEKNNTRLLQERDTLKSKLEEMTRDRDWLKKQLENYQELASSTTGKLREALASQYDHLDQNSILQKIVQEKEQNLQEYRRCYEGLIKECERLRKTSPDELPKIIALPLKSILLICNQIWKRILELMFKRKE